MVLSKMNCSGAGVVYHRDDDDDTDTADDGASCLSNSSSIASKRSVRSIGTNNTSSTNNSTTTGSQKRRHRQKHRQKHKQQKQQKHEQRLGSGATRCQPRVYNTCIDSYQSQCEGYVDEENKDVQQKQKRTKYGSKVQRRVKKLQSKYNSAFEEVPYKSSASSSFSKNCYDLPDSSCTDDINNNKKQNRGYGTPVTTTGIASSSSSSDDSYSDENRRGANDGNVEDDDDMNSEPTEFAGNTMATRRPRPREDSDALSLSSSTMMDQSRKVQSSPPQSSCDLIVKVGGQEFYHSSALLAYASDYLKRKMIQRGSRGQYVIDFSHHSSDEWKVVLEFLQPRSMGTAELNLRILPIVLPWFAELNLKVLLNDADLFLLETVVCQMNVERELPLTIHNLLLFAYTAFACNLETSQLQARQWLRGKLLNPSHSGSRKNQGDGNVKSPNDKAIVQQQNDENELVVLDWSLDDIILLARLLEEFDDLREYLWGSCLIIYLPHDLNVSDSLGLVSNTLFPYLLREGMMQLSAMQKSASSSTTTATPSSQDVQVVTATATTTAMAGIESTSDAITYGEGAESFIYVDSAKFTQEMINVLLTSTFEHIIKYKNETKMAAMLSKQNKKQVSTTKNKKRNHNNNNNTSSSLFSDRQVQSAPSTPRRGSSNSPNNGGITGTSTSTNNRSKKDRDRIYGWGQRSHNYNNNNNHRHHKRRNNINYNRFESEENNDNNNNNNTTVMTSLGFVPVQTERTTHTNKIHHHVIPDESLFDNDKNHHRATTTTGNSNNNNNESVNMANNDVSTMMRYRLNKHNHRTFEC